MTRFDHDFTKHPGSSARSRSQPPRRSLHHLLPRCSLLQLARCEDVNRPRAALRQSEVAEGRLLDNPPGPTAATIPRSTDSRSDGGYSSSCWRDTGLCSSMDGLLFDLLSSEVNEEHLSFRIKVTECMRRDEHQATGEPSTGVGDQIAHGPIFIVEVEVSDVPNLAVGGPQFLSVTLLNAV